jgi:flagellar biosynthesis component FlhA
MFLAGVMFSIGLLVGTSGTVAIVMGLVALAAWFKRWWVSKSEQARQQMADQAELRKEMLDQAGLTLTRSEKVLFLLRYPSQVDEHSDSSRRRTEYVQ